MTIFTTPILKYFLKAIGWLYLKCAGWKIEGSPPSPKKYVILGVPHTSNWDFPLGIAFACIMGINLRWIGKIELFKGLARPFFLWLGGIPVDRNKKENVVEQTVQRFKAADEFVLVIAPEGTRKKVARWKSGFYYIALGAGVPILPAYVDNKNKVIGFGPFFDPTGNYESDLKSIQDFYVSRIGER